MEISPSGSISGVINNFVTIDCCPSFAGVSQLNITHIASTNIPKINKS